jgi:hypothetical protein
MRRSRGTSHFPFTNNVTSLDHSNQVGIGGNVTAGAYFLSSLPQSAHAVAAFESGS